MKRRALIIAISEYENEGDTEYCQSNTFNIFEMHRLLKHHKYDITTNYNANFTTHSLDKDHPRMTVR